MTRKIFLFAMIALLAMSCSDVADDYESEYAGVFDDEEKSSDSFFDEDSSSSGSGDSSNSNQENSSSSKDSSSSVKDTVNDTLRFNEDIDYRILLDRRDMQSYKTVIIGENLWMAENLNYADTIANSDLKSESRCFDNDEKNCKVYGRLYTARVGEVCPEHWHIPKTSEWEALIEYVKSVEGDGYAQSLMSLDGWDESYKVEGTDKYGFRILPGGHKEDYTFYHLLSRGAFWAESGSLTDFEESYDMSLSIDKENSRGSASFEKYTRRKNSSLSVRCISDSLVCDGTVYYPGDEFCHEEKIYPLCGGNNYNPVIYTCLNDSIVRKDEESISSSSSSLNASSSSVNGSANVAPKFNENIDYRTLLDRRDMQSYKTVIIGENLWMAENLNYADTIANSDLKSESRCFDNDEKNCKVYGRLYTSRVDGICPDDWHVPTNFEWEALIEYVKSIEGDGYAQSLMSLDGWKEIYEVEGTDKFGFRILPGGYRSDYSFYKGSFFWAETGSLTDHEKSYGVYLDTDEGTSKGDVSFVVFTRHINSSLSVRCISDSLVCNGTVYYPGDEFCHEEKIYPLCGGNNYNPVVYTCLDESIVRKDAILSSSSSSSSKVSSSSVNSVLRFNENIDYRTLLDRRDMQSYKTVIIGENLWMAENLNYADTIANPDLKSESRCFDNDKKNCKNYGRLYTARVDGICPDYWHIPSTSEWDDLIEHVKTIEGDVYAQSLMSLDGWKEIYEVEGTDKYGFRILPSGYKSDYSFYSGSAFWAETGSLTEFEEAYEIYSDADEGNSKEKLSIENVTLRKYDALSVRCISDSLVCNGTVYYPGDEFCHEEKIYPLCGGDNYNPAVYTCLDDSIVRKDADLTPSNSEEP